VRSDGRRAFEGGSSISLPIPAAFGPMQEKARAMVGLAVPGAEFGMKCAGNLPQLFTHLLA